MSSPGGSWQEHGQAPCHMEGWKDFLQKSRTGGSASYVSVEGDVLYTVFDFQGLSPQSSPSNSRMMFFFLFLSFENIMLVLLRGLDTF